MNVTRFIKEVKWSLFKVRFLQSFLGAAIVFLLVYVILLLFALPTLLIALTLGILYLITELVLLTKTPLLRQIEQFYPDLDEALRTVEDTSKDQNEIVEDLRKEVMLNVKKEVDVADFMNVKKLLSRSLFIIFLAFAVVFFASLNIQVLDAEAAWENLNGLFDKVVTTRENVQVAPSEGGLKNQFKQLVSMAGMDASEQVGGEIYGQSKIAQLGESLQDVEVRPTNFEISIDDYEEPEDLDFVTQNFAGVEAQRSAALEEHIPEQQQEVVQRYFEQLATVS